MIEVETTVGGDPYADVADLLAMPAYLEDVFDEQDLAEMVVAGRISADRLDDLLAGMGWDDLDYPADPDDRDHPDGRDGFGSRDPFMPIGDLDEDGLLEELHAAHRATSASQARLALLITELTCRRAAAAVTELTGRHAREPQPLSIEARAVIEEVRLALCLGVRDAGDLTDTALGLCTQAPDTLDALLRGDIDLDRAQTILRLRQSLVMAQADTNAEAPAEEQIDPEQLGKDLEDELLKNAHRQTRAQLRRAGEKAQISANPKAAEYRHKVKRARRNVTYRPDSDSMCRLSAYLPADQGIQAKNALPNPAFKRADAVTLPQSQGLSLSRSQVRRYWIEKASGRAESDDPGWYFAGRRSLTERVVTFLRVGTGVSPGRLRGRLGGGSPPRPGRHAPGGQLATPSVSAGRSVRTSGVTLPEQYGSNRSSQRPSVQVRAMLCLVCNLPVYTNGIRSSPGVGRREWTVGHPDRSVGPVRSR